MNQEKKSVFRRIDILFIVLFFLSFISSGIGALFTIILMFYWKYGTEGAIKALILITTRGIMSNAVAATPLFSSFRWIIIVGSSLVALLKASIPELNKGKINRTIIAVTTFSVMVIIASFLSGSYPVTSMFKVISFTLPFIAVMVGVLATSEYYNWNDYFTLFYSVLFIISAMLIPFARFRITNSDFQGVFNHVNMFGIVAAIYIAAVLNSDFFDNHRRIRFLIIAGVLGMIYLSSSRTGMFTAIITIVVYELFSGGSIASRFLYIILIIFIGLGIVFFAPGNIFLDLKDVIYSFVFKNNYDSIWASRQAIIAQYQIKYESNPMFGRGFMTPYVLGFVNYALDFNLVVEPGNLIWALLGDTGIIGTFLFGFLFLVILSCGKTRKIYLLICAFVINMGEMVFFSSNNMSILLYLMIALYMFDYKEPGECVYEGREIQTQ